MFNIGGWALFRKSERLLFGVRLYVSHEVISKTLPDALTMYHDLNFGIEDLPKMLGAAGFSQSTKLDEKFLLFRLVSGIK